MLFFQTENIIQAQFFLSLADQQLVCIKQKHPGKNACHNDASLHKLDKNIAAGQCLDDFLILD